MTIRITRLRRQFYKTTVELYVDDRLVARLAPGVSASLQGSGAAQELVVRSEGFADSPPLLITDPGETEVLGVLITYSKQRTLFSRAQRRLLTQILGQASAADIGDTRDDPDA